MSGTSSDEDARALVVLHADTETLGGRCTLERGGDVAIETARRLACDAGLLRVGSDGQTIGRRTRVVPAAMKRSLRRRDRQCRFPACSARRVDAHHVQHWARGGHTSLANLVLLCQRHHRLVHEGGFGLSMACLGEPEFRRPDGRVISAEPMRPLESPWPSNIGPDTSSSLWDGRAPDYGIAVEGLLAMTPSAHPAGNRGRDAKPDHKLTQRAR